MTPSIRTVRTSLLSRGMKYLVASILLLGAVMLYLVLSASSNTPMFARDLPLLLFLGVSIVLALMVLVGYQLLALRRRLQAGLFGSKLTLRLVLLFSLVAVLPGALVYSVSVQFLNKSIESWFDVRVEKALEGGLSLGRTTLDNMLRELNAKADSMAVQLADARRAQLLVKLEALRDQAGVREAALFQPDGTIIAFSIGEGSRLMPSLLPVRAMQQARVQQPYREIESEESQPLRLRVVVPVNRLSGELVLLQLVQPVPATLARDAETVQAIYQDYQELSLSRGGLKRLYGLSLTLSLLLALLCALVLAIVFSERLSAPLVLLAAGTRAVAQGDFSQRHPVRSHDELGILTASFNTMTTQLEEARGAAMRNQQQLEGAKAYVESILAKLSAGVLSFDSERRLRLRSSRKLISPRGRQRREDHQRGDHADRRPAAAVASSRTSRSCEPPGAAKCAPLVADDVGLDGHLRVGLASFVAEDVVLGPAGEVEPGARGQEIETGLGDLGAALARQPLDEDRVHGVEIAHVGGGIFPLRVAQLRRRPSRSTAAAWRFPCRAVRGPGP